MVYYVDHLLLSIIAHPTTSVSLHSSNGFAHLVYPGAVHSRLLHSLGAYHLMSCALGELENKGTIITPEEELGQKLPFFMMWAAILMLENELIHGIIMRRSLY
jgi:hypothetical protein